LSYGYPWNDFNYCKQINFTITLLNELFVCAQIRLPVCHQFWNLKFEGLDDLERKRKMVFVIDGNRGVFFLLIGSIKKTGSSSKGIPSRLMKRFKLSMGVSISQASVCSDI
jgi:hypothetical protein